MKALITSHLTRPSKKTGILWHFIHYVLLPTGEVGQAFMEDAKFKEQNIELDPEVNYEGAVEADIEFDNNKRVVSISSL